jgi:hypothetical protein
MILEIKKFSESDQIKFANFSGDFNEIHLDPSYASRTPYEKPIVHGIHILLYSLECLTPKVLKAITSCRVIFNKSVQIDQEISINWDMSSRLLSINDSNSKVLARISDIQFCENHFKEMKYPLPLHQSQKFPPQEANISSLKLNSEFSYEYNGDSQLCQVLYPELSKLYSVSTLCEIAKLSAFVGMKIPGKYSLFRGINMEIGNVENPTKTFKISSIDERVGAVSIEYTGFEIKAQLNTFFRPKPIGIPLCAEINQSLNTMVKYENMSVLIIGGSRGLGAWASKIFAVLGFNVTLTYNQNYVEAKNVQDDIVSFGGNCRIVKFNVLTSLINTWQDDRFDFVLYFATPAIISNYSGVFNSALYNNFRKFYVESFEKFVVELSPRCGNFFYPSTILIDAPELGFEEYIKAKTEGEIICRYYTDVKNKQIIVRRLPRLATDQNNWIFGKNTASPMEEMVKIFELLITT